MFKFVMTKNSNELFHRAILYNDIKRVKLIVEEALKDPRFNIDEINDEGLTGLQFSCFAGNLEVVKILVSRGANWKIRDRDGYTVLHASAMAGHGEIVKFLIRTGLRPTVRSDDGMMPIDVSEDVAVIVILLRAMLDQGYLQEMQDYMLDHPKLKQNIFQELEKVKCREKEKNEILKDLPYSSHSPTKYAVNKDEKRTLERKGRTRSTFCELSDSMQHLDKIPVTYDYNNNPGVIREEPIYEVPNAEQQHYKRSSTLTRQNSTSSNSSHGSKASRTSVGSGGILRNENFESDSSHRNMQRYLENRYPLPSKSVTFDLGDHNQRSYSDGYISDQRSVMSDDLDIPRRAYSDGYASDNFDDFVINPQTSTFAQLPNSHSSHSNEYDHRKGSDETIYENTQTLKAKSLPTINENHYENLPLKQAPPPVPPRMPAGGHANEAVSERQHGSETDSGIDINETTGRVFALSLDDQKDNVYQTRSDSNNSRKNESYSQPMGLFLSQFNNREQFFLPQNSNNGNSKYQSWNGRTLQSDMSYQPYASHRRKTSKDDYDIYNQKQQQNFYNVTDTQKMNSYNSNKYQSYNFDETEDIML